MSRKKSKNRKRKYKPYEQVKMKFFQVPNLFGDAPSGVRINILRDIGAKARATFEREFPRVTEWFDRYDPLYILSFCVFYFMTSERGIDKEAIEGKLDFGSHHLELLQAIALMRPRHGTPEPLKEMATELKTSLRELTEAIELGDLDFPADLTEAEIKKRSILSQMRTQTLAIRNWAFPEQTIAHMKSLYSGPLEKVISQAYAGVTSARLIDSLVRMSEMVNDRLNGHLQKLAPAMRAQDFQSVYSAYRQSFPDVVDDESGMRHIFDSMCGGNLKSFKALLMVHADLRLPDIFTFTLDDVMQLYGEPTHRDGVRRIVDRWSYRFGDLDGQNPKHFIYSNPVLLRPFVAIDSDSYFWVMSGILGHTLPGMFEAIIPMEEREKYMRCRSEYLEASVEALCKTAFPDGEIYRGSQWCPSATDSTVYENDLLVIIDSTALVIECKAQLVDPPARRGAEFRLVDTLEDVVVAASVQAERFVAFVKEHPQVHSFDTLRGVVNKVDARHLLRFVPFSVTYENLGYISADLKRCVEAGLIGPQHTLIPSICLTDLEIILETLDSQSERIHYLSRRAEIEKTMHYLGDELDLFAFYLDSGFNIGDWEEGKVFLNINMKSKELDPYFVARADGVSVPKPKLDLSDWWRVLLGRIENVKKPFWTEIAYVLLNVGRHDQNRFERKFRQLLKRVLKGRATNKYNWVVMLNKGAVDRRYAVVGFPYRVSTRDERNNMIKHIAADLEEETPVLGLVTLGIDVGVLTYPYDVMVYVPGHAPGAPDFKRVLGHTESGGVSE
jgi:hypothetical protein